MSKRWTSQENNWLIDNYGQFGIEYCSRYLNRSHNSISQQAKRLGLKRQYNYHQFTKKFLEQKYTIKRKSITKIANEYQVSEYDVYTALLKNDISIDKRGMYKHKYHHNWKGFGEISQSQWGDIQKSAKDRKIEFNINIEYAWSIFLKQDRKCALSGIPLQFSYKSAKYYNQQNASLDRIDSSKGYIEDNVQWVDKNINFMKRTMSDEEFIHICSLVYKYRGERIC